MLDPTLPFTDELALVVGGVDPGDVSAGFGETDGAFCDGVDRCVDVGTLMFVLIGGGAVRTTGSG